MWNARRESEVDQLDSFFSFIEQYVLKFDVPVCDVPLVAVVNGLDDLSP